MKFDEWHGRELDVSYTSKRRVTQIHPSLWNRPGWMFVLYWTSFGLPLLAVFHSKLIEWSISSERISSYRNIECLSDAKRIIFKGIFMLTKVTQTVTYEEAAVSSEALPLSQSHTSCNSREQCDSDVTVLASSWSTSNLHLPWNHAFIPHTQHCHFNMLKAFEASTRDTKSWGLECCR